MKLKLSKWTIGLCVGILLIVIVSVLVINNKSTKDVVAEYKGGVVTEKEHTQYLNILQFFSPGVTSQLDDPAYLKNALKENIAYKITEERGRALTKTSQSALANEQWKKFIDQYESSFSYNEESIEQRLKTLNLSETDLIDYIEGQIYGGLYLKSTLDEDTLQKDYKLNASLHNYDLYDISQIQISLTPDGLKPRTKEEALNRANEVVTKWRAGEDFTKLAQSYSDDPSLQTNGGQYLNTPIYGLDSDIKQGILDLPLHQISNPLPAESGYYIIRVDKKITPTYEESMEALKNERVQSAYSDFITKELPALIISIDTK